MTSTLRITFEIRGTIQGVGFRPALHRLATELRLGGEVQNRTGTVRLTLEGPIKRIDRFLATLPETLPPHASIREIKEIGRERIHRAAKTFKIVTSDEAGEHEIQIPADLAMCDDCAQEVFDKTSHRYRYPFTTCTNCGPRYTVVNGMPYDRERTTLRDFPLCPACAREYANPADRRFHAETTACPDCGPQLRLCDSAGRQIEGDPIVIAARLLAEGRILAVRGIGGFLLAADAMNRDTLMELRRRKARPDKPFAVMASSLDAVTRFCNLSDSERAILASPQAPIVILDTLEVHTRGDAPLPLDLLSPDTRTLGVMLPTSPLHSLLASSPLLVMTSGNRRGEPIAIGNDEALTRLNDIADAFLLHNREINLRCDDSLCIVQPSGPQVWRRARGYAPQPMLLPQRLDAPVLAMGAELKNTIALGFRDQLVLSPHIGDLETPEALDGLEQVTALLPEFLQQAPVLIAVDLNPDMHASRLGRRIAASQGLPVKEVQHHHAHGLACLAEHGLTEGLALVFDGAGLGNDGSIWGAELLDIDPGGFRRLATFAPVPLPGGDEAVKRPARQLLARWIAAGVAITPDLQERLGATDEEIDAWTIQTTRRINAPDSCAAGRLFDAFSAALGAAPPTITYEGQAAIRLEALARTYLRATPDPLPFESSLTDGLLQIDWSPLFAQTAHDTVPDSERACVASAFHYSLALAARQMVEYAFSLSRKRSVALSGGVFMNRILTARVIETLSATGARVLAHHRIPPNDGGIAAGQILACAREQ